MDAIKKPSFIYTIFDFSVKPGKLSFDRNRDSFCGEAGVRLLHAVQLVTSFLALPIIALLGLCSAAYQAFKCDGTQAKSELQATMSSLSAHIDGVIIYSAREIFITRKDDAPPLPLLHEFIEKIAEVRGSSQSDGKNDLAESDFLTCEDSFLVEDW